MPFVHSLADRARLVSLRNFRFGILPYVRRREGGVCEGPWKVIDNENTLEFTL